VAVAVQELLRFKTLAHRMVAQVLPRLSLVLLRLVLVVAVAVIRGQTGLDQAKVLVVLVGVELAQELPLRLEMV
jgi:hypothetical protein